MENFGIGSWLQRRRPKSGTKTAIIAGERSLSYSELAGRSTRLANALRDRGVIKGDRVAYLGENDPSFLETLFAAGLAGAVFVPLNTRLAPPEIQFQLRDSGAVVLVHSASLAVLAERGSAETAVGSRIVVDESTAPAETVPDPTLPDSTLPDSTLPDGGADGGAGRGTAVEAYERPSLRPVRRWRRTSPWAWTTPP